MKITGGKYRNKNIEVQEDRALRPTMARTREAIFNILQHGRFLNHVLFVEDDNPSRVEHRSVVDLFCGTGALGLEALSRGAEHITFVDQNQQRMSLARSNAAQLGETARVSFVRSDSTRLPPASRKHDLAFIDPPYRQKLEAAALESLRDMGWLKPGAIVILEGGKQDDPPEVAGYHLLDTREHDKTRISVLQFI